MQRRIYLRKDFPGAISRRGGAMSVKILRTVILGFAIFNTAIFGGEIFGLAILKFPKFRAFNSPHRDLSDRNLKF